MTNISGNLATRSLRGILDQAQVLDTEYLKGHVIAVPCRLAKEFKASYESICPMVVPRSAQFVEKDDEFELYIVTIFKKHDAQFQSAARERRWILRTNQSINQDEDTAQDHAAAAQNERRKWADLGRMTGMAWGEIFMIWCHALALRTFVETVLRYGLPLDFVACVIQVIQPYSGIPLTISAIRNSPPKSTIHWTRHLANSIIMARCSKLPPNQKMTQRKILSLTAHTSTFLWLVDTVRARLSQEFRLVEVIAQSAPRLDRLTTHRY